MTVPTDDPGGAWTPQALPEHDALAREPAPDEVALAAGLVGPDVVPDVAPDTAPFTPLDGPAAATPPQSGADAAVPDDAPLTPEVALVHSTEAATSKDQAGWTAALVGLVLTTFFALVPVQVLVGGVLLWSAVFAAGGTLAVAGGIPTIRSALSRGTVRRGPVVALVCGFVVIVGCAVVSIVGANSVGS